MYLQCMYGTEYADTVLKDTNLASPERDAQDYIFLSNPRPIQESVTYVVRIFW